MVTSFGTDEDRFEQISRDPSLADKVTATITDAIVSGRLQTNEPLPSERELADQFGVSRTVIREAVRSLVAQGLVETRSGRGVRVALARSEAVTRSMSLFMRTHPGIDYGRVHEVRSALEIEIAAAAADRATRPDIDELARINDELGAIRSKDANMAAKLDVDFHRAIAQATHNPLFVVMLDSIHDVLLDIRIAAFANLDLLKYAHEAHAQILDRLIARDQAGARDAMRAHLDQSERHWRRLERGPGTTVRPGFA